MKILLFSVFCFIIFINCNSVDKGITFIKERTVYTNNNDIKSIFYLDSLIEHLQMIKLETNDQFLIGEISKVRVIGDTLVIIDKRLTKSIFLFHKNGNFIKKINKQGEGPNEYKSMHDADIDFEKRICVLDQARQQMIKYDLQGTFIEKIPLSFYPTHILPFENNAYFLYNWLYDKSIRKESIRKHKLVLENYNNKTTTGHLSFSKAEIKGEKERQFQNKFCISNEKKFFLDQYRNMVYEVDASGIISQINIKFAEASLSDHVDQNKLKSIFQKNEESKYAYLYGPFFEVSNWIVYRFVSQSPIVNFCLFDKRTQKSIAANSLFYDKYGIQIDDILYSKNDTLICKLEVENYLKINKFKKVKNRKFSDNIFENLNYGDNPILIFFTLK